MKEELVELFKLTDEFVAEKQWAKWFDAALQSNIKPLVKFARQKVKQIKGLVAHALWQINTGKLEGFNNKIKVAKRNSYGFRNSDYFSRIFVIFLVLVLIDSTKFYEEPFL